MNPILRQIAEYMSAHQTRSRVDPLKIGVDLLRYLYILEIERHDDGARLRLRIRLAGTALDRAFGRILKGHYLEEFMHGPRSADVLEGFYSCARTRGPIWMRQVVKIIDRPPRYVEGVAFYVEPDLIYGGLTLGEMSDQTSTSSFESRKI